jgi:hypothetical protein
VLDAQFRYAPADEALPPGVTAIVDQEAGVVRLNESPATIMPSQVYDASGHGIINEEYLPQHSVMSGSYAGGNSPAGNYSWQLLPVGHIYRAYLAGTRESRMSIVALEESKSGRFMGDATLGGRFGVLRYGTEDGLLPQGFQLDIEGAAFPRLDWDNDWDLDSVDFRGGIPLTFAYGKWRTKIGYYHLSAHLGDEFLIKNGGVPRINYVRDAIVLGQAYQINSDWRIYGEAAWAFYNDGGAEPWEFQFGAEYSPYSIQGPNGMRGLGPWGSLFRGRVIGSPFIAANGHLREELDFSGNFVVQAGWQWRNPVDGRLLRLGAHYFNGKSVQFEFFNRFEQQYGLGLWYDY